MNKRISRMNIDNEFLGSSQSTLNRAYDIFKPDPSCGNLFSDIMVCRHFRSLMFLSGHALLFYESSVNHQPFAVLASECIFDI